MLDITHHDAITACSAIVCAGIISAENEAAEKAAKLGIPEPPDPSQLSIPELVRQAYRYWHMADDMALVPVGPLVLRKDGLPFKTRQVAALVARTKKFKGAELVQIEGGWAIQETRCDDDSPAAAACIEVFDRFTAEALERTPVSAEDFCALLIVACHGGGDVFAWRPFYNRFDAATVREVAQALLPEGGRQ